MIIAEVVSSRLDKASFLIILVGDNGKIENFHCENLKKVPSVELQYNFTTTPLHQLLLLYTSTIHVAFIVIRILFELCECCKSDVLFGKNCSSVSIDWVKYTHKSDASLVRN